MAWDIIFLIASTGLGKTYWGLHHLYEYAIQEGWEIAVLVNRRFLREQLLEEVRRYDMQQGRHQVKLHIFLYQELEREDEHSRMVKSILKRCQYIICDESHYFCADALFNPRVQLSFDYITKLYETATLIFISATIERVRPFIERKITALYTDAYEVWEENVLEICQYKKKGKGVHSVSTWKNTENMNWHLMSLKKLNIWADQLCQE